MVRSQHPRGTSARCTTASCAPLRSCVGIVVFSQLPVGLCQVLIRRAAVEASGASELADALRHSVLPARSVSVHAASALISDGVGGHHHLVDRRQNHQRYSDDAADVQEPEAPVKQAERPRRARRGRQQRSAVHNQTAEEVGVDRVELPACSFATWEDWSGCKLAYNCTSKRIRAYILGVAVKLPNCTGEQIQSRECSPRALKRCSRLTTVKEYAEIESEYERDEKRVQDLEEKAQETKDQGRRTVPATFAIVPAIAAAKLILGAL